MNNPEFTFGGFTVPAGCKRIYITAKLEPSNGDPRIQPTGFPDVGPVCYPDPNTDPAETKGLICLIQSEPAMANLLEEVCLADKYTGTLKPDLSTLPYINVTENGQPDGEFKTSSTIDGHRFASEYLMKSKVPFQPDWSKDLVTYVIHELGASSSGDHVPAANVPLIFELAMELDPLSLIHGFQISIKNRLTFVGLRSSRALTACILGYRCQQRPVPGVRLDPIGTGDAGQAIFQKERIVAGDIEAKFSIDVGLLASMRLASADRLKSEPKKERPTEVEVKGVQNARYRLLVALAVWKVAAVLKEFEVEHSLRTECKLRLEGGDSVKYTCERGEPKEKFDFNSIVAAQSSEAAKEGESQNHALHDLVKAAKLPKGRSPLTLKFA
jgi:CRISPR-associated protein Csb1